MSEMQSKQLELVLASESQPGLALLLMHNKHMQMFAASLMPELCFAYLQPMMNVRGKDNFVTTGTITPCV